MLVTLLYYIPNAAPTEKNPAPPRSYRRNFICNIIEKGLGFSVQQLRIERFHSKVVSRVWT